MDPLTLSAIIGGGTSLLSLFKPDNSTKQQKQQQGWLERMRGSAMAATKPTIPYFETYRNLPAFSNIVQKAILGNMSTNLGGELLKKYGINMDEILGATGLNKPFAESYEGQTLAYSPANHVTRGGSGLLKKYVDEEDDYAPRGPYDPAMLR